MPKKEFVDVDFDAAFAKVRAEKIREERGSNTAVGPDDFNTAPTPEELHAIYNRGFQGVQPGTMPPEERQAHRNMMGTMPRLYDIFPWAKGLGKGKVNAPFIAAMKLSPEWGSDEAQARGDCFVAGTMVTGEVTKPIEEVEIGDNVWTGEGKLTRVVSKRVLSTTRPLVRVSSVGGQPLTCTEDHKILVYRMARVAGKRVNAAYYGRSKAEGGMPAVVECYERREPTWVHAGDLCDTDYLLAPIKYEALALPDLPQFFHGEEGAWAAGYLLGNGYIDAKHGGIEFSTPHEEIAGRLERHIILCGFNPQRRKQDGAWCIRFNSTVLARWARLQFYNPDKSKNYPGWAIGNEAFLNGVYAADGHTEGRAFCISNTSRSVVYGLYATLVTLGYVPALRGGGPRTAGCYANGKPIYVVEWRATPQKQYAWRDERYVCRPVKKVERIEGPAVVYDIGVADAHHSFIANGHAVSNCTVHGTANACEIDHANDALWGETQYKGRLCKENIYRSRGSNGDGWSCAAPCRYVGPEGKGGLLYRQVYKDPASGDEVDLSKYNPSWEGNGRAGTPPWMEELSRKNKVKWVIPISDMEEYRDALAACFGINVCSGQGFSSTTDSNGLANASGSWSHSMAHTCCDDTDWAHKTYGDMIGGIQQSWGRWNKQSGKPPGLPGMPVGMFMAKASPISRMISGEDSFAMCSVWGWERTGWEAFDVTGLVDHLRNSTTQDYYITRAEKMAEAVKEALDSGAFNTAL